MKRPGVALMVLLICGALVYFGLPYFRRYLVPSSPEYYAAVARTRAGNVLQGWSGKSNPKLGVPDQYALSQWAMGKIMLDRDQMEIYSNKWDGFRQRKGLYRTIGNYDVGKVVVDEAALDQTALVDITIEGKPYTWIVTKGQPIAWAN